MRCVADLEIRGRQLSLAVDLGDQLGEQLLRLLGDEGDEFVDGAFHGAAQLGDDAADRVGDAGDRDQRREEGSAEGQLIGCHHAL